MSHLLILPAGASVCASDIRLVRLLGCSPVALKCRLEVVIWRVPSLIAGSTVAVSIVSVLVHLKPCPRSSLWVTTLIREPQLGPIYPIVMNHVGRILPRLLLIGHSRSQNLLVIAYSLTVGSQDRLGGSLTSVKQTLWRSRL